jgi:ribonucleotide monophosphatase NagD (HAD superfamily)
MANKKSMNNRNNTDNIATGIHTGHNIDNKESNEDYIVKSLATLWEVKYFLV